MVLKRSTGHSRNIKTVVCRATKTARKKSRFNLRTGAHNDRNLRSGVRHVESERQQLCLASVPHVSSLQPSLGHEKVANLKIYLKGKVKEITSHGRNMNG
jgi:hypothetical protein